MKYQFCSLCDYILHVLPLWTINFFISPFDWLRINNKCGFRLANKFAQRKFFKFFITKDNWVRTDEFASIPILLPFKSLDKRNQKKYKYICIYNNRQISLFWFFPNFISFFSLSQTETAFLPSLINWVQCHIFYFYYRYSGITQTDKKNAKSIKNSKQKYRI